MSPACPTPDPERAALGIPPLPLSADQVREVCAALEVPQPGEEAALKTLLLQRVPPGVDPAARVKADWLAAIAYGSATSPIFEPAEAVLALGTMMGGYNLPHLTGLLDHGEYAPLAASALKGMILVFDAIQDIHARARAGNGAAKSVLESWADAEWFTSRPPLPEEIRCILFKVDGEINTDDLSPAKHAPTRPDIPLHAQAMGETRFPGGLDTIAAYRAEGHRVAFVGDTVGTGSSRKSATNSLIWHIGDDIPHVPNKRRGGIVLGSSIAPIFFNTFEDAGGLPIRCDVSSLHTGDLVTILPHEGCILNADGKACGTFTLQPTTLADEYRAGGRVPLLIGRKLTDTARELLGKKASSVFRESPLPPRQENQGYTLAQKMVGRACGKDGVLPGETCQPRMSTVGSQDTTGPMTRDEMTELACLKFQAPMVMQSFCHTAAYPTDRDTAMHATLPDFIASRGGVALRPGDGIIHSWLNRLLLPDEVGTGGDSHTRFPLGISFPAGSGLVAFAAALGCMPLDMPESVLVRLSGTLRTGLTLRDVVNAIPLQAIKAGLQSPFGTGTRNIFNSRILELEGTESLSVEDAFELTCASAERSAAACTVVLREEAVVSFVRENVALMERMIEDGYRDAAALRHRIDEAKLWLQAPSLLRRDGHAEFAATLDIDLSSLAEPALACPNNPDHVAWLSEHAGEAVDEVFLGSCMTHIGHFRTAARVFADPDARMAVRRFWVTPPTRMIRDQLVQEGVLPTLERAGARIEIPGCSLCMGNQARVDDNAVVFSTSTRNFDNRMGAGARVYLGSAALAAIVARHGTIPTPDMYFAEYARRIGD